MKTFLKIVLTLAILGTLGYCGWWAYNRYFAEAPKEGTVYVQSVSAITGVGPAGRGSRYGGVVEAKNVIEIDPDKDLTVKECFVSAGDKVTEGAPLFSYDVASMEITHQQLILDIQGLENDIRTGNEKLEKLKNKLARARENQKLDIQTDVNAQELELRKKAYELANKQKDFETIERFLENTVVCSPVTGKVRSVKSPEGSGTQEMGYGDGSQSNAYITIVAGNDYCVKGTVSEQTIHTLQEGMPAGTTMTTAAASRPANTNSSWNWTAARACSWASTCISSPAPRTSRRGRGCCCPSITWWIRTAPPSSTPRTARIASRSGPSPWANGTRSGAP